MMKKQHKSAKFALTALAFSLFATSTMAKDITISQEPLLGVTKITPSVVLALSVEYPTAGIAYNDNVFTKEHAKEKYLGYFDNDKCYQYTVTVPNGSDGGYEDYLLPPGTGRDNWRGKLGDGYFRESGNATTSGEYVGLCPGASDWSGNMLNYMTMSALDIFRQTLTGGNRAKGVGSSSAVYSAGDPTGENKAYLRRAMIWRGQESDDIFPNKTGEDLVSGMTTTISRYFGSDVYADNFIDNLVPTSFMDNFAIPESLTTNELTDPIVSAGRANYNWIVAQTKSGKYYTNKNGNEPGNTWYTTTDNWHKQVASGTVAKGSVDINSSDLNGLRNTIGFVEKTYNKPTELVFWNVGTGFYAALYVGESYGNRSIDSDQRSYQIPANQVPWFNVVVEKNEKTTGIIQDQDNMRFAALGYLTEKNNNKNKFDGGVLRAKMRNVLNTEINTDGTFKLNPDSASEGNSGVINYVNKFGDDTPYDAGDPVRELYYTAIRYLRNGRWKWNSDGTQTHIDGSETQLPYPLSDTISSFEKGIFPVIKDWDDPFEVPGDKEEDKICYAPSIIVIGDLNTHADSNIPNLTSFGTTYNQADNVGKNADGSSTYNEVCKLQGICSDSNFAPVTENQGNNNSPLMGLAGMAYWVKRNDVRPDISKLKADKSPIHISSFFIDVLEGGRTRAGKGKDDNEMRNSYYLAGKFASPNYETDKTYVRADFDSTNELTRSLWTNDRIGDSSSESFPLGMPKNFAVANNPKNMRNAIIEAFKTIGFAENTLQSAIQYNNAQGAQLNVTSSGTGSAALISEGAIVANKDTSGKVTGYTIKDHAKVLKRLKDTPELVPLTFHAGYNTKTWTGYLKAHILIDPTLDTDTYGSQLIEAELWNAGQILFNQYHNNSTYSRRNVQSKADNTAPTKGFMAFNAMNADSFSGNITGKVFESDKNFYASLNASAKTPANLINYLLGDSSKENTTDGLRVREESLMGTSVYSSVTPILRNSVDKEVKGVPIDGGKTCKYSTVRSGDYVATSSNEGMLHIFDMDGNEKYAYVPQTALPYIANYANPQYQHRYVNDGHAMLHEVCDGTNAATYLVGTSGRGASSIYAIDVTNDNFKAVLEVNNQNEHDIGLLVSAPIVANQAAGGTGAPVMIFSSGYNNTSGNGHLFVYNLKTGKQLAKVELGKSGVGSPVGYDSNNDGIIDRVYVGDYEGKLWRVDMQEPTGDNATWDKHKPAQLVFQAEGPILTRPAIGQVGDKTAILLGTGTYLTFDDMRAGTQNYGYGIFDDGTVSTTIDASELHVQEFTANSRKGENGLEDYTFYEVTHNPMPDDAKGWRLVLPKGFTITSDSAFYGPQNQLATYTATKIDDVGNKQCNVTGETLFIAVDARNGGAYERAVFDVDNDLKFDNNDALPNGYYPSAVGMNGVGLDMSIANTNHSSHSTVLGSTGQFNIVKFPTGALKTRRVSWREIF